MRRGRREDAIDECKTALTVAPDSFDVLYNLGTTLADSGRMDEARPYLD